MKSTGCVFKSDISRQTRPSTSVLEDLSGNKNDGTITGATWTQFANRLWALYFDGNDYITITNSPTIDFYSKFTIKFWNIDNTPAFGGIISRQGPFTAGQWALYHQAAGRFDYSWGGGVPTYYDMFSGQNLTYWRMHVLTINNQRLNYYVDTTNTRVIFAMPIYNPDNNLDIYIGRVWYNAEWHYLTGYMSGIEIYRSVWSFDRVRATFRYEKGLYGR